MKNELKISTLSIVCVLCAAVAMPASGASSVRSLGGAGTYASASSAAAAKSDKTSSGATNSVRGGSMRVNNSASSTNAATRSSSTRSATTPRLSIGKYLAGSSAVSGGSSIRDEIGKVEGSLSDANGQLQGRIVNLEKALGLYDKDGLSGDLIVDVEALQEDLNRLEDGMEDYAVTADYTNAVLTIKQGDKTVLSESFATASGLEQIQKTLNELAASVATKAAQADVDALETAVAKLETAVENLDTGATGSASQIAELVEADKALQAAIDELEKIDHSVYATTDSVNGLVEGLAAVDTELKNADKEINEKIAALQTGSSESGADLTAVKETLTKAVTDLAALTQRVTTAEQAILANADAIDAVEADVEEIVAAQAVQDSAISGLQELVGDTAVATQIKNAVDAEVLRSNAYADEVAAGALADAKEYTDDEIAKINTELGTTGTDVSSLTGRVDALESGKQDKLTAGNYIDIENGVISSTLKPSESVKIANDGTLSVDQVSGENIIGEIDGALIKPKTMSVAALDPSEFVPNAMAMAQIGPNGEVEWVPVMLVDDPEQVGSL